MAPGQVSEEEFQRVLERLKHHEEAFASVRDRLEAFERLERIARERQSSPEVVAAKAATVLLERKLAGLLGEVKALTSQRDATRGELEMLLMNKKQAAREAEDVRLDTDDVASNQAVTLNELEIIRKDGRQLRVERKRLLKQLGDIRSEIADLTDKRDGLFSELGRRGSDDLPLKTPIDLNSDSDGGPTSGVLAEGATAESEAFDRFFSAKIEDDKARDWILK